MKAIYTILAADSNVTGALYDGAEDIYLLQTPQQSRVPFIVVGDSEIVDPNDTFSSQLLDEYNLTIYVWGQYLYDNGNNTGANDLAALVRTALHGVNGEYSSTKVKINFQNQSLSVFPNESTDKYLVEQEYQVFVNRA